MSEAIRPALLMVAMEPPASLEEEFNDWYDTEHFPQRLALPGFVSASRWACIDGWPRWLALYDLTSPDALNSAAYRSVSGAQSTPWSRRVLPRTVGRSRVVAVGLDGQDHTQYEPREVCRLLAMSVALPQDAAAKSAVALASEASASAQAIIAAVREALTPRGDLLQLRGFVEDDQTLWLFASFDSPASATLAAQIGRPCGASIRSFNVYVPYRRSSY
ncbi:hypothetical protein BTH42_02565 [Burkholderia sp. SRS-W-2-2016]|uniref:DUF4286 family protein n=1 Tax=Burkholderia sp. SRS-W-2-2016 TaxID=1926878 RepID=UPI00094B0946|nr:DUF4286 family protein [Burkholderia sp. SRS-W-2-2016]OLL33269.1 hypothetical protein BTH42_02565 [Burkholderia sp. SRS-W-2-2016]